MWWAKTLGGEKEEMELYPLKTAFWGLYQGALFLERGLNGVFNAWLRSDTKKAEASSYLTDFLSLSFLCNFCSS